MYENVRPPPRQGNRVFSIVPITFRLVKTARCCYACSSHTRLDFLPFETHSGVCSGCRTGCTQGEDGMNEIAEKTLQAERSL